MCDSMARPYPVLCVLFHILIVIHDEENTSTLNLGQTGNL